MNNPDYDAKHVVYHPSAFSQEVQNADSNLQKYREMNPMVTPTPFPLLLS